MATIKEHVDLRFKFIVESFKLNVMVIIESDNRDTAQKEAVRILSWFNQREE